MRASGGIIPRFADLDRGGMAGVTPLRVPWAIEEARRGGVVEYPIRINVAVGFEEGDLIQSGFDLDAGRRRVDVLGVMYRPSYPLPSPNCCVDLGTGLH
jgi:hypothetical protein